MGKIYTESGWVNWDYLLSQPESFLAVVGARGTGKTYGALTDVVRGVYGKIVYVRRNDTQLSAAKLPELNPFKRVNADMGTDLMFAPMGKNTAGIYHGVAKDGVIVPSGSPVGLGVPLSVFSKRK